jgi:hypothetical protein
MADTKITALAAIGANPINVATFPIPMVDLLDTSMAASGTTKKVTVNQILGAGGTATLASATITGDLTVATNKLKVTGGNVGIGTATPTNYANYTTLTINGTNGGEIDLTDGGTLRGQLFSESTGLTLAAVGGLIKFGAGTGGTEKMRLDASGNLLVGTTGSLPSFANGRIEVLAVASSYCIVADATATSAAAIGIRGNDSTVAASFYNASTGGTVGSIVINSGGVSYNTTSDYRLKESVKPISGGLARVNALKPSVYNWKSNGSTGEGFLAHELAEVVPFAVSGEKDAVNADGSIKSQGIDMSRVVPILVAAIQELTARVQTLETR